MPQMPSTPQGRRIVWLGAFIVVVVVVYIAGWFYFASVIETRTALALANLQKHGVSADCRNTTVRGFPFRIGLFCDSVDYADQKGVAASAGAFRSAGQIYDPLRLIAELDGPASLAAPGLGDVKVNWSALRASARLAKPLPSRLSLEGGALKAARADGQPLLAADTFEGHMRPNGADIDLAWSLGGLAIDASLVQGRVLPPIAGTGDITVTDGVRLAQEGAKSPRGLSAMLRSVSVTLGGTGGLTVSGPVSVDADGLVNAELKLELREPAKLAEALVTAFPEQADRIRQGFGGLALLGSQPSLPLRIVKGNASLGFIPLGTLPPLPDRP